MFLLYVTLKRALMNWPALPFVRLILPLGSGILLGTLSSPLFGPWLAFPYVFLLLLLLLLSRKKLNYKYRRWFGVVLFTGLMVFGFSLMYYHTPRHHPQHLRHFTPSGQYWKCRIDVIKTGTKNLRTESTILAVTDSNHSTLPASGKILLYIPSDSLAHQLEPGSILFFRAKLESLSPPMNPHAFDFAAYLSKKGIYHRAFVRETDWIKASDASPGWSSRLFQLQRYCLNILTRYLRQPEALAIGAALIMGQRDLISEEIREAYTDTGSIHVLAVSGLHVGIIYLGLGWLLGIFGLKGKKWRWPRSAMLILAIWAFALFTGGSASVLRAASMFSFLIIGNALFRRHNIYNTLAASAFLLLCIQPRLLFDVGFQLSYLAVIGIVFFQGRIYRSWYIPNRAGDYLWKLASVSLAAQLTTLPISLFYFHQFPLYFWLSGWVVVPAALIILSMGIGLLLLHGLPLIPDLLGMGLETIIQTMNQLIFSIQQLPMALLSGIWLGSGIILLLYLVLLQFMKGLHYRRLRPIQGALIIMIAIGIWNNIKIWQAGQQRMITVYHLYGHSAIDIFHGRQGYSLSDLPANDSKLTFAAENHRAYHRMDTWRSFPLQDTSYQDALFYLEGPYFQIDQTTGLFLDKLPQRAPPTPIPVDILILRNNARLDIDHLVNYFVPRQLLFDASNYRDRCEQWAISCQRLGLPYHDIGRQGAWIGTLE